mgnify:FL=1
MAQNDVVDIDEVLDEKLLLDNSRPPGMVLPPPEQTIEPGWYGPKTQKRELLSPDVKNYLMDKFPNLSPTVFDTIFGAPNSIQDRYLYEL